MIFGETKAFAIEVYHEPSGPAWGGFGRFSLHVHDVSVGDIRNNHCFLFDIAGRFRHFSGAIESLWMDSFTGLSDAEVFRLIDDDIYGDGPPSAVGPGFENFDFLTNAAEMLNNTKTFIFCDSERFVHLLYRVGDDTFGAGSFSVQIFRSVADGFLGWFDEQVRTTAPPFFPINPFDLE